MAERNLSFGIFAKDHASKVLDDVGEHMGMMHRIAEGVGLGIGASFGEVAMQGVEKLKDKLVEGFQAAAEYQQLQKQTEAVIASTGQAARVSVGHVQEYATQLQDLSGVEESQIIHGENLMLTFTGIRNQVGKGNNIFDQATKASLNLSVALGQDMQSSVIQVGKALNDPIKGVTALQRVGVSFTAQQKEQIKTLVAHGHTLEAQKLILGELNREFGGAAKAAGEGFSGSMKRAKLAVDDAFRSLAMALMPTVTKVANIFSEDVAPAITTFTEVLGGGEEAADKVHGPLKGVADVALTVRDMFTQVSNAVKAVLMPIFQTWVGMVKKDVVPMWQAIFSAARQLMPTLVSLGKTIISFVVAAFKFLEPIITAVYQVIVHDIIPGFLNLARGVLPLVQKVIAMVTSQLREHHDIVQTVVAVLKILGALFKDLIVPAITTVAGILVDILGPAFSLVTNIISNVVVPTFKFLMSAFLTVVGVIIDGAAKMFGWVPGIGGKLKSAARAFDKFKGDAMSALDGIGAAGEDVGAQLAAGIIAGIHAASPQVQGVANKLGAMAAQAVKNGAMVMSPSRITIYVGRMIGEGLRVGISASHSSAVSAASALARGVMATAKAMLPAVNKEIGVLQQRVNTAQNDFSNQWSNVTTAAKSFAGVGSVSANQDGSLGSGDILGQMEDRLNATRQFQQNLAELAKRHLNTESFADILNKGVDGGGQLAQALANDDSSVNRVNQLQRQIDQVTGALGKQGAQYLNGGSLASAKRALASEEAIQKVLSMIAAGKITARLAGPHQKVAVTIPVQLAGHEIATIIMPDLINEVAKQKKRRGKSPLA